MRKPIKRRVIFGLASVSLAAAAFYACSTDSPTSPGSPPGQGVPPPATGTWNIVVTANPPQLVLPPPGEPVPTSSILIQVRRASDNSLPPSGATVTANASGGTLNGSASVVLTLTNGEATTTFTPTVPGTAVVQAQLEGSTGQASISVQDSQEVDTLVLSHVNPNVVDPAGGQTISIFGVGIREPVRVNIGGVDAQVLSTEPTRIRVRVPPRPGVPVGSIETVNISVTSGVGTPFQASDTLTGSLIYAHGGTTIQPAIFSVTPTTGPNEGGTVVTIRGTGFQSPVQVRFGLGSDAGPGAGSQVEAEIVSVTASEVRALSPPAHRFGQGNLNNPVDITIINLESGFRATEAAAFRYGVEILITAMGPNRGPFTGGTTVTLHGQGFEAPVALSLGGVGQQVLSVSGSQILFRTSAVTGVGCGQEQTLSPVSVTNITTGASGSADLGFTFVGPPAPIITGIFPASGPQAGGFNVTITGSGFENPVRVELGGQASPDASANLAGTQVVAAAPAFTGTFQTESCVSGGVTGERFVPTSVDVRVINLGLGEACATTLSGGFTYNPADTTCRVEVPPPTANFDFGGASGSMTVSFTDTSTGNPTSWSWSFGDGNTSTQRNPSHTYAAPGTYAVTLTASNQGGSDSTSRQVTVPLP